MEEEKKNPKNNSKGLIITLVITIIIILSLIVYILYDKGVILKSIKNNEASIEGKTNNSKKENQSNDSNNESQPVDSNSDIVQNLYGIFRLDKACYMSVDGLNNNNLVKLRIAYENIPKQNFTSVECSKLEKSGSSYCGEMSTLMLEAYSNGDIEGFKKYEQQNSTTSISANLIEAKLHELFGSDYKVNHESFGTDHLVDPSCHFMKYDKANNLYAQFNCEGGGTCGAPISQELVSASKKGNELYIVTNLTDVFQNQSKATYTFKKDENNNNYVFVKIVQE